MDKDFRKTVVEVYWSFLDRKSGSGGAEGYSPEEIEKYCSIFLKLVDIYDRLEEFERSENSDIIPGS